MRQGQEIETVRGTPGRTIQGTQEFETARGSPSLAIQERRNHPGNAGIGIPTQQVSLLLFHCAK